MDPALKMETLLICTFSKVELPLCETTSKSLKVPGNPILHFSKDKVLLWVHSITVLMDPLGNLFTTLKVAHSWLIIFSSKHELLTWYLKIPLYLSGS